MKERYTILLADDHVIFRQGIRGLIDNRSNLEVVGEVNNGADLLEMVETVTPDLIILDISMPGIGGLDAAREIKKKVAAPKILVLTMHKNREYLYHALSVGVSGYLLKEDSEIELFRAIETIQQGRLFITPGLIADISGDMVQIYTNRGNGRQKKILTSREKEVVKLVATGKSNREIADLLFISTRTVENHRANVMKKLDFKRTAELIRYAIESGFLED